MVSLTRMAGELGSAGLLLLALPARADPCADLLPGAAAPGPFRDVTALDLAMLRDIGNPHASPYDTESPLAVSPDGRQVAFLLQRAVPKTNQTCLALVVAAIGERSTPHILDRGGVPITIHAPVRGLIAETGVLATVTPGWSPDGKWLAWRKRTSGASQLWIVRSAGGSARQLTDVPDDVETFAWSPDSASLVFRTETGRLDQEAALAREGSSGFLYDDRFAPTYGTRPRLRGPLDTKVMAVDLAGGMRDATSAERALLVRLPPTARAQLTASGAAKNAWTEPLDSSPTAPVRIWTGLRGAEPVSCADAACSGEISGLWWNASGTALRYVRLEGWAREETVLYDWGSGSARPREVLRTRDVLQGCVPAGDRLLCIRQNATTPRRIVTVDVRSGRVGLLFDPNPEFASLRLGRVRRLYWRNALGLEAWGDLVLPPGGTAGTRWPLVIVQYHSDGFLRGGTGDEYPIHALAARGIALLSLERPAAAGSIVKGLTSYEQIAAANARDWAERRSLLSSLLIGVESAIATGTIDPSRVGITGMSDGATTVAFALASGHAFAAASMSSCCMDPNTVNIYGGPAWAAALRRDGYPPAKDEAPSFWKPASLARAAARIQTPILMQLADQEYLLGLEAYTALRENGRPVEMYVFPDEAHTKRQPAHRLAIYERNLDWFDFWLRGSEDSNPAKAEQYARWRRMRDSLAALRSAARPDLGIDEPHQPGKRPAD